MLPVTSFDYILLPFYLILIFTVGSIFQSNSPKQLRHLFMPALSFKIICSLAFVYIYRYVYKLGDTFGYFNDSASLTELFLNHPLEALGIEFSNYEAFISKFPNAEISWNESNNYVAKILFPFTLLGGKAYIPTTLLLSFFNFLCSWSIFRHFSTIYPKFSRILGIIFLFAPNLIFWSSGILKDTFCMSFLYVLYLSATAFFVFNRYKLKYIILILVSGIVIYTIKSYILIAFAPTFLLYLSIIKSYKIKNKYVRKMFLPLILVVCLGFAFVIINSLQNKFLAGSSNSAIENAVQSSTTQKQAITESDANQGSGYDLVVDPTISGLLLAAPASINVTLFRPYIWETRNFFMLLAALESLFLLTFTIYIIYKIGLKKIYKIIFSMPILIFLFSFSILLSVFVGISAGNFGTLVRYKIPAIPFFTLGLVLLFDKRTKITRRAKSKTGGVILPRS